MATRKTRQTSTLSDTTTGTVNIVQGHVPTSQNSGFFGGGFTNTHSSSGKKRRRRLHARAQQQAAQAKAAEEARIQAEAQAQVEHEARVHAESQAVERARIEAETHARMQREQAYRDAVDTLANAHSSIQSDLAQRYSQSSTALENTLLAEIESGLERAPSETTGHQVADLIFQEKIRINQLLAQKQADIEARQIKAASSLEELSVLTPERYRHYLDSRSQGDPVRAHQAHQDWIDANTNVHEAKRLADAIAYLDKRSSELSERHAQLSVVDAERLRPRPGAGLLTVNAERLWSAISGPTSPSTLPAQSEVLEKAVQIAKKLFVRAVVGTIRRSPRLALFSYSPTLGNGELPSSVLATPVSQINLPSTLDLEYVAGVNGTVDVPHRLVVEDIDSQATPKWVEADGVNVGTKVRVRHFAYNAQNNTYEFIRDGDSTPALVWTPIEHPTDSSTSSPGQKPLLPVDPGVSVSPQGAQVEILPGFVNDDPDDYILVFPAGSGLPDTYVLFKSPRHIPGVATGYGKPVTGIWLGESTRAQGAPIPSHIADQLRGRRFSNFDRLREAIWGAVAKDAVLREQFILRSKQELDAGNAPFARKEDHVGSNRKFEIHHMDEIAKGGAVYDIDNLVIMTPKQHVNHHRKSKSEK